MPCRIHRAVVGYWHVRIVYVCVWVGGWVVALNTGCIFCAVMNTTSGFFLVCWLVPNQNVVRMRAQEEFCITLNPLSRTALCCSLPTDRKTSRVALRLLITFFHRFFLLRSCLQFSLCLSVWVCACLSSWVGCGSLDTSESTTTM